MQGMGAPIGSMVAGPKDFIVRVRKYRKMLGGGMRQAGIIAAPGDGLVLLRLKWDDFVCVCKVVLPCLCTLARYVSLWLA